MVMVCGICCNICGKIKTLLDIDSPIMVVVCGKNCDKIEKLSHVNKNWCGSRY